jgi:hypothetical protein
MLLRDRCIALWQRPAKYRTPSIDTLKRGLQDYLANSQSGSLATDAQKALDDLDAQIAVVDSAPASCSILHPILSGLLPASAHRCAER